MYTLVSLNDDGINTTSETHYQTISEQNAIQFNQAIIQQDGTII